MGRRGCWFFEDERKPNRDSNWACKVFGVWSGWVETDDTIALWSCLSVNEFKSNSIITFESLTTCDRSWLRYQAMAFKSHERSFKSREYSAEEWNFWYASNNEYKWDIQTYELDLQGLNWKLVKRIGQGLDWLWFCRLWPLGKRFMSFNFGIRPKARCVLLFGRKVWRWSKSLLLIVLPLLMSVAPTLAGVSFHSFSHSSNLYDLVHRATSTFSKNSAVVFYTQTRLCFLILQVPISLYCHSDILLNTVFFEGFGGAFYSCKAYLHNITWESVTWIEEAGN